MKSYFKKEMALLLTLLALTAGCGREAPPAEEGKIPVAASFGAMEKLTEAIGVDAVSISVMVPEGIEPHDFEPRAGDLIRLKQARVFVYNGMGMEHWAEKALQSAGAENQEEVRASEKVVPIPLEDEEEREEHGDYDPHTWLGLSEAKEDARAIRDPSPSPVRTRGRTTNCTTVPNRVRTRDCATSSTRSSSHSCGTRSSDPSACSTRSTTDRSRSPSPTIRTSR